MIASHSCGVSWVQRGSQTGHCCGCHRTFASEDAFDLHRSDTPDGGRRCADPADRKRLDGSPALVQKHDGHSYVWSRAAGLREAPAPQWECRDSASGTTTELPLVSVPDIPQSALEGHSRQPLGVRGELLPV